MYVRKARWSIDLDEIFSIDTTPGVRSTVIREKIEREKIVTAGHLHRPLRYNYNAK